MMAPVNVNQVGLAVSALEAAHADALHVMVMKMATEGVHLVSQAILVMHVINNVPLHVKVGQRLVYQLVIRTLGVVTLVVIQVFMALFVMSHVVRAVMDGAVIKTLVIVRPVVLRTGMVKSVISGAAVTVLRMG